MFWLLCPYAPCWQWPPFSPECSAPLTPSPCLPPCSARAQVPELWLSRSFPSNKPLGAYVREVEQRCEAFSSWLSAGPPVVFWISGFFFTQAFLTGAKQNFARRHRVPIDLVDFDFEVRDDPAQCTQRPDDGLLVRGMFLEAAAWDDQRHMLRESAPKVLHAPLPVVWFRPRTLDELREQAEAEQQREVQRYTCPLYKTSERRGTLSTTGHSTNFVCELRLPSDQPQAHWVKRGVALLLSLDS